VPIQDHNLDDLILNTEPKRSSGAKNLLSIVALFIVVLIAGIFFTRIFFENDATANIAQEENITQYVSPELALKEHQEELPAPDKTTEDESYIEIPESPVEDAHNVQPEPSESVSTPKLASASHTPEKTTAPARKEQIKKTKPVRTRPVTHAKPKKTETKPPKPATPAVTYYVQVGSFSKPPANSARLLQVIRNNGYRYIVHKTNGMYKVLIGPYPTRAKADKAIGTIRAKINKQAFVYTMK
jgi:cell division septation protein DedD